MWYGFPVGYDFRSPPDFSQQPDLQTSRELLRDWLIQLTEQVGIPLGQTILAGFSQGGAMALDVGLQLPLGGIMCLSGYLHGPLTSNPHGCPLLMVHGLFDPVVPVQFAQLARDRLTAAGITVRYHELPMGHEIQPLALEQIRRFCEVL